MMELLAGITIVALSGENGILRQAVKAKDKTEIAEIIDKAQVDVLGAHSENGVNYYNVLMNQGIDTFYWVASRCTTVGRDIAYFSIRMVYNGFIYASGSFDSSKKEGADYSKIFPIVSLNATIIRGNATDGFTVE